MERPQRQTVEDSVGLIERGIRRPGRLISVANGENETTIAYDANQMPPPSRTQPA
jgi:hypothetical protein